MGCPCKLCPPTGRNFDCTPIVSPSYPTTIAMKCFVGSNGGGNPAVTGFPFLAPLVWSVGVNSSDLLYPPSSTGIFNANTWQSDTYTAAGRVWHWELTVSGIGVGQVTLSKVFTTHPDPSFPGTAVYTNVFPLNQYDASGIPMSLDRSDAAMYPWAKFLGVDLLCSVTLSGSSLRTLAPTTGWNRLLARLTMTAGTWSGSTSWTHPTNGQVFNDFSGRTKPFDDKITTLTAIGGINCSAGGGGFFGGGPYCLQFPGTGAEPVMYAPYQNSNFLGSLPSAPPADWSAYMTRCALNFAIDCNAETITATPSFGYYSDGTTVGPVPLYIGSFSGSLGYDAGNTTGSPTTPQSSLTPWTLGRNWATSLPLVQSGTFRVVQDATFYSALRPNGVVLPGGVVGMVRDTVVYRRESICTWQFEIDSMWYSNTNP